LNIVLNNYQETKQLHVCLGGRFVPVCVDS